MVDFKFGRMHVVVNLKTFLLGFKGSFSIFKWVEALGRVLFENLNFRDNHGQNNLRQIALFHFFPPSCPPNSMLKAPGQ